MIIGGAKDIAVTPASAARTYTRCSPPKRLVRIGNIGHNAFSDACLAIRSGTDLIGLAQRLGIGIPDRLLELGRNGCEPGALDTKEGWRIIQHFTVAELRVALGIDKVPVGLGPGIADAFPGVKITYLPEAALTGATVGLGAGTGGGCPAAAAPAPIAVRTRAIAARAAASTRHATNISATATTPSSHQWFAVAVTARTVRTGGRGSSSATGSSRRRSRRGR